MLVFSLMFVRAKLQIDFSAILYSRNLTPNDSQMSSIEKLEEEDFDFFLNWLSSDSKKANAEYEILRNGLIIFFRYHNCNDLEALADETITRVATKLKTYKSLKDIPKVPILRKFAKNIYHEYLRTSNREVSIEHIKTELYSNLQKNDDEQNVNVACFKKCLAKMSGENRKILIDYYRKEGSKKIEARKKLSEKLNIALSTLHVKVYRLRNDLKTCIEKCVEKKSL